MRVQIFSMDLLITVLIIMLILPFMVYINYQINFKQVHIKKIGVIVERYYIFANIISYICLARIDPTYGKILPNYIDYENSVMWAVRLNLTQGLTKNESLTKLCVKIFKYNTTKDAYAINHCVAIFSRLFDICKDIDTKYRWFLTDRFGKVIFVSYRLNKTNDYRIRLCLSNAWQRFTYGYGNGYTNPTLGNCDKYLIEKKEVIHVPFVGVARTKQPIWFLDINDNLRQSRGININNFNNMEEIPVGFISSDFLLYIFNKTPPEELENNTVIDTYDDAIPIIFTDVKKDLFATDECTTNNMVKISAAVNIINNLQSKISGLIIYTSNVSNIYAYNPRCSNWHGARVTGYSPGPVVPNPFTNRYSSLADVQNIINNANSTYIINSGTYYIVVLDWLYYADVNNLVNKL